MYSVYIEKHVFKDLDNFPVADIERIEEVIRSLRDDPHSPGTKKLRGYSSRYRARQGKYRIVYEIDEKHKFVRVMLVSHRKDAYRSM